MAQKKSRQTFEKVKREPAVRERRARKQERKAAARLAKAAGTGSEGVEADDATRSDVDGEGNERG